MKKITNYLISLAILFIGIMYAGSVYAIDAPHNTSATSVDCTLCHVPVSATPPAWATGPYSGDNTMLNGLCNTCHNNPSSMVTDDKYNNIQTHSANVTGSTYDGGTWTVECVTCHNPHYQRQPRANLSTGYIESGTITSASTATALTDSTKAWTTDQWKNYVVVPNKTYPTVFYEIESNTATVLTVRADQAGMTTRYLGTVGTAYGIKYGKLLNDAISTSTGTKSVKLLGQTGTNSFADGDATYDGICQVCHQNTQSFTANGIFELNTRSGSSHPSPVVATNCISCHSHKEGFKGGGCNGCHGYPPGNLVNNPASTGTTTPGAHVKHVSNANMVCDDCHTGGMKNATYSNKIEIGFGTLTGTYDGRTAGQLANGFTYSNGNPATTTITQTGAMTCAIYCHDPSSSGAKSPAWGSAFSGGGECDDCHGNNASATAPGFGPMTSGKHTTHINSNYKFECARCHNGTVSLSNDRIVTGSLHANRSNDVVFYSGGNYTSPNCSNTYCHSNGMAASGTHANINWSTGPTQTCASCHGNSSTLVTGAHSKHLADGYTCNNCHNATASNNSTISTYANHVNNSVTVNLNSASAGASATYNGQSVGGASVYQKQVGSTAGTCNATYCHGSQSYTWSDASHTNDAVCVKCHGVAGTNAAGYTADIKTAAPGYNGTGRDTNGDTVATDKVVGAHDTHLRGLNNLANPLACTDCHAVSNLTDSGHMNGTATMVWSSLATSNGALTPNYNSSTGQCSNVYCHGDGFGTGVKGVASQPTWTDTGYLNGTRSHDCNQCHLSPPTSTARYDHSSYNVNSDCTSCHQHNGTGSIHINGQLLGSGNCDSCHDYDTVGGTWGKGSGSGLTGTSAAWGDHAKHIDHLKAVNNNLVLSATTDTYGGPTFNKVCGVCHSQNKDLDHGPNGGATTRNVNFNGDTTHQFGSAAPSTWYNSTAKTCSSVDCHFKTTPTW